MVTRTLSKCPNCTKPIAKPNDGCVLHDLIQVVRERGVMNERTLLNIHGATDASAFWDDVGAIVDKIQDGYYRAD